MTSSRWKLLAFAVISVLSAAAVMAWGLYLQGHRPHAPDAMHSYTIAVSQNGQTFYLSPVDQYVFFGLFVWLVVTVVAMQFYVRASRRKQRAQ